MKIRGITFENVFIDSARGFAGEGFPHHKWFRLVFGSQFGFDGSTDIGKTMTPENVLGQLPLEEDGMTPKEIFPRCIRIYPLSGHAINNVRHSNRGLEFYLGRQIWREIKKNFLLSLSADAGSQSERLAQWKGMIRIILRDQPCYFARFGIVLSLACPNVDSHNGKTEHAFIDETLEVLDLFDHVVWPRVVKLNLSLSGDGVAQIANHRNCDAVQMTNAIKWGSPLINWEKHFGTTRSPLATGPNDNIGAYSGPLLKPLLMDWLKKNRRLVNKPMIVGGGIHSPVDVRDVSRMIVPSDGMALSSITLVRPHLVQRTIDEINLALG